MPQPVSAARASSRPAPDGAVVFLHIHKTAGTTLRSLIDRQYPPEQIASVDWQEHEAFRASPLEDRARVRMLRGHMAYGLHAALPRPSTYITLLRDPVERAISHYYWVRERPEHVHKQDALAGDLVAYLEKGVAADLDNGQVRLIAGEPFVPVGGVTEAHLQQAIENLDARFAVAGLSERFDESLMLLRRTLGWRKPLYYTRQNRTRSRPRREDDRTVAVIRAHNELDVALYEHAARSFDEAVRRGGPAFAREVAAFRRMNRSLNRLYPLIGPARRAVRTVLGRAGSGPPA